MDGMGTSNIHGSGSGAAAEAAAVARPSGGAGGIVPAGQGSDNASPAAASGGLAGVVAAAAGQVADGAARATHAVTELVSGVAGTGASETAALPSLRVLLAGPRGFCAGVDRAIRVVEEAIKTYGAPVYVRHEIVHNRTVVEQLETQGAVFVEELDEVPANAHVVFSAHGVPKSVPAEAQRRNLAYLDATCPLVSKVHREAERHFAGGGAAQRHILMIGHAGHPEVVGTMGQLPPGAVTLVQDAGEARVVQPADPSMLAFITQTTLSVDDTAEIVEVLRTRFPLIEGPKREDICYATTNRQQAVKAVAPGCDLVIVIGSPNSSNSQRLREVAERAGAGRAVLVPRVREMDWSILEGVRTLGITAGASAPESLVQEMLAALAGRWTLEIEERRVVEEHVTFRLPAPLA